MTLRPLPDNLILLVKSGGEAYGTSLPGSSDHDEIGVVVESPNQCIGIERPWATRFDRTQAVGAPSEPGDIDRQIYSVRELVRLALAGNPSILSVFWSPVIRSSSWGDRLQRLGRHFVGRHVVPRFRGYMNSQARRLVGEKGNAGHGPMRADLIAAHGYDTKYAMHVTRLGLQCQELLITRSLQLPLDDTTRQHLLDIRQGRFTFEEWWEGALKLDANLAHMATRYPAPDEPNREHINREVVRMHWSFWGWV